MRVKILKHFIPRKFFNYICNYNNNNTNSVNTIQTSAFYLQGSYELERYVQLECNSRNVNESSFISNQMTNSIDCFDDIISFVPEYIIINYDNVHIYILTNLMYNKVFLV